MYVNRKEHYLTNTLFLAAGIHILSDFALFLVRKFVPKSDENIPDIANQSVLLGQIAVAVMQVILMAMVFMIAYDNLKKALSVVDESDRMRMAILQKETLGSNVPTLTGNSIKRLLEIWGVILVVVRMVYDVCSLVYRRFIADLFDYSSDAVSNEDFIAIYNNTHGFKYIGLFIALLLGALMTGIFLNDKLIKVTTVVIMAFFLLSFVLFEMQTITIGGYRIGIVWTSVIFHLIETLGLIILGLYLRKKYIGL